jgi:hypothetical protein
MAMDSESVRKPSCSFLTEWLRELARDEVRQSEDSSRPIVDLQQGVLGSSTVREMPPPEGEQRQPGEGKSRRAKKNAKRNARSEAAKEAAERSAAEKRTIGQCNQGGKREKRCATMPRALWGNSAKTADGRSICFSFNLPDGCSEKIVSLSGCDKGLHVCCKPGCAAAHPFAEHPG